MLLECLFLFGGGMGVGGVQQEGLKTLSKSNQDAGFCKRQFEA